ncbi:MAG: hypothetical protein IT181_27860 [Acidobacteria bacterium]|nr:hypothetical protein [Acidobacteriota bacterium]
MTMRVLHLGGQALMPSYRANLVPRSLAAVAAVALLVVAGCRDDAPGTSPTAGGVAVRGRVLSYRTAAPVAGASVVFDSLEPRLRLAATTSAGGDYVLMVPAVATFEVHVNGALVGLLRVHGPGVSGDLFVDGGTCSARYGTLYDNRTLRPVPGATATVSGLQTESDARGWYRLTSDDCPDVFQYGGTTFMTIAHPKYETASVVVGRGFQAVMRHDIVLTRK